MQLKAIGGGGGWYEGVPGIHFDCFGFEYTALHELYND